ncbi:MAG: FISUMP domain-containing protein [Candidatus Zixiibacteriota bacterium]
MKLRFYSLMIFIALDAMILVNCGERMIPTVTTSRVSSITEFSAQGGGSIASDGGATITALGVCWSNNQSPTLADNYTNDGTGKGNYTSSITELIPNTTYYVRAYATNSIGTGYGEAQSFRTIALTDTVIDIDGNIYQTIKIGDQWWMVENLRVTHYRNGDPIPNIINDEAWANLTTGAYCNPNNNETLVGIYGRIYNWYAINDDRIIAPKGWHVATHTEWNTLIDYLGGASVAAGKIKEAGLAHWERSDTSVTNESGFTALPSGHRYEWGFHSGPGGQAAFWTSTEIDDNSAWNRSLHKTESSVSSLGGIKQSGASIRCVKD